MTMTMMISIAMQLTMTSMTMMHMVILILLPQHSQPPMHDCLLHIPNLGGHLCKIDALQQDLQQISATMCRLTVVWEEIAKVKLTMQNPIIHSSNEPLLATPDPPATTETVISPAPLATPKLHPTPTNNPCCTPAHQHWYYCWSLLSCPSNLTKIKLHTVACQPIAMLNIWQTFYYSPPPIWQK